MHDDVIAFWFHEIDSKKWWTADAAFDEVIRQRFGGLHQQAAQGELHAWRISAKGRLAEVIVLDQFSRNIHRNAPQAFAQDSMALELAQEAISRNALQELSAVENNFLLMPFMHSESKAIHVEAEKLFKEFAPKDNYNFELRHKAIIDRFGRYPHRNAILGRTSTPEELDFLKQPGSAF